MGPRNVANHDSARFRIPSAPAHRRGSTTSEEPAPGAKRDGAPATAFARVAEIFDSMRSRMSASSAAYILGPVMGKPSEGGRNSFEPREGNRKRAGPSVMPTRHAQRPRAGWASEPPRVRRAYAG